jgi:hypothetical protein
MGNTRVITLTPPEGEPMSKLALASHTAFNAIKKHATEKSGTNSAIVMDEFRKANIDPSYMWRVLGILHRTKRPLITGSYNRSPQDGMSSWSDLRVTRQTLPATVELAIGSSLIRKRRERKGPQIIRLDVDSQTAHDVKAIFAHFEQNPKRTFATTAELEGELNGKVFGRISGYMPFMILAEDAPLSATRKTVGGQWRNIKQIRTELPNVLKIDWGKIAAAPAEAPAPTPAPVRTKPTPAPKEVVSPPVQAPGVTTQISVSTLVAGGNMDLAMLNVSRLLNPNEMREFLANLLVGLSKEDFAHVFQAAMQRR